MDAVGKERINEICYDHNYKSVLLNNYIGETTDNDLMSDNFVSTNDLCRMFLELYCNDDTHEINRPYLLENFGIRDDSLQNSGLGSVVEGVVGSFNGVKSDKFNEIILVERDGRAYVMSLMANGVPYSQILSGMRAVGSYVDPLLMAGEDTPEAP